MQGSSYSPHLIHELQDGIESSRIFSAQMNCSDSTTWAPGKSPLNDAPIIACLHSKGIHVIFGTSFLPIHFNYSG